MSKSSPVVALTSVRNTTHGNFSDDARISGRLKDVIRDEIRNRINRSQPPLDFQQRESLDLICTKIARIIAGDPSFPDHWDDIAGYAHIAIKEFPS